MRCIVTFGTNGNNDRCKRCVTIGVNGVLTIGVTGVVTIGATGVVTIGANSVVTIDATGAVTKKVQQLGHKLQRSMRAMQAV